MTKPKLALVKDGAVVRRNLTYGKPIKGVHCSFTKSTTLETYAKHGLYPIQTQFGNYNPVTQIRSGPRYEFSEATQAVLKIYTLTPISQEDQDAAIAAEPMLAWEREIAALDADMPRWAEDLWDVVGIETAPQFVQDKHAAKKTKRAEKPEVV